MPKRLLLTGAAGAIGVHFVAHFLENTDWEVIALCSFRHKGYFDRLTYLLGEHPEWQSRVILFTHDLAAPITEREAHQLGTVDFIVNLASLSDVADSLEHPAPFIRNNVEVVLTMLEYARAHPPRAFVQFSTDEVYGPAPKDDGGHPEWDTILPSNPYAASKAAQEAISIAYWRSYGVPLILTNTMNNFAPMQSPSKFPAMIQKKLKAHDKVTIHASADGQIGTRYYLHSRNAADAVLFLLTHTTPHAHEPGQMDRPDRYNIVGDKQLSNLELAQTIARLMDKPLDYEVVDFHSQQPGHDLHYGLNGSKLSSLGWTSPQSFEDSLKETIDWQETHPEWMD